MLYTSELLALIWVHFIADFLLQTDKQALGKSSSNKALLSHVLVYTAALFYGLFMVDLIIAMMSPQFNWKTARIIERAHYVTRHLGAFCLLNGILHFAVDYVSSRWGKKLYAEGRRRAFFAVVGLDQALHMTCLALTQAVLR